MDTQKLEILYITNIPSPYVVDYLNELGKLCKLTAIFERLDSSERDESWKKFHFKTFEGFILKGKCFGVDQAIAPQIVRYLKQGKYDGIIVANPCTPTGILATRYMRMRNIDYIIESEGGIAKSGKGLKETLKKIVLSGAKLYFSTGEVGDEYFRVYGAPNEKIKWFPFTTLYRHEILTKSLTGADKRMYKAQVECDSSLMLLTIGQFVPRKGMDILMRACVGLPYDVEIVIVGGKPTTEYLQLKEMLGINNLKFVSYSNKEVVKKYYKAADIFVLATREDTWGLVIPEAMSFGVPVISTDACVAAVTLIEDGKNGFVVPSENVEILRDRICRVCDDENLRSNISQNNIVKMQDYSLERMAERQIEEISQF